jgi:hypothetical protein
MFSSTSRRVGATGRILVAKRTVFNTQKLWSRENIPVYGIVVGTAAISFQVRTFWIEQLALCHVFFIFNFSYFCSFLDISTVPLACGAVSSSG